MGLFKRWGPSYTTLPRAVEGQSVCPKGQQTGREGRGPFSGKTASLRGACLLHHKIGLWTQGWEGETGKGRWLLSGQVKRACWARLGQINLLEMSSAWPLAM